MIVTVMCVAYGLTMGVIALAVVYGKVDVKKAASRGTIVSIVWLPLCMVAVVIRAWLTLGWLAALIVAPFACVGIWMATVIWRLYRALERSRS